MGPVRDERNGAAGPSHPLILNLLKDERMGRAGYSGQGVGGAGGLVPAAALNFLDAVALPAAVLPLKAGAAFNSSHPTIWGIGGVGGVERMLVDVSDSGHRVAVPIAAQNPGLGFGQVRPPEVGMNVAVVIPARIVDSPARAVAVGATVADRVIWLDKRAILVMPARADKRVDGD